MKNTRVVERHGKKYRIRKKGRKWICWLVYEHESGGPLFFLCTNRNSSFCGTLGETPEGKPYFMHGLSSTDAKEAAVFGIDENARGRELAEHVKDFQGIFDKGEQA